MKHEVHDLVVVQFSRSLSALKGLLLKAREHAAARKFDENNYLQLRIAPDMFPFVRQVQFTTDTAKAAVARLTGKTAPVFEDKETSLSELIERLDKTIAFLQTTSAADFEGYENRKVEFFWNPGMHLTGKDYLPQHALPNFYFHMNMAYSMLRNHGIAIGKGDYLGEMNWKKN